MTAPIRVFTENQVAAMCGVTWPSLHKWLRHPSREGKHTHQFESERGTHTMRLWSDEGLAELREAYGR